MLILGDEKLRAIAQELVTRVRSSVTTDWEKREGAKAAVRLTVKKVLRKHGYPPDATENATAQVLEQGRARGEERRVNPENIDLRPLANAVDRLREGLERYERDIADTQIRDGLIQRFEFTYEISHRMLKRYLAAVAPDGESFAGIPFADLIRSGNEAGLLLSEWPKWKAFREMRGRTSHTYDEPTALTVVSAIPAFLCEAEYLRDRLRERLA